MKLYKKVLMTTLSSVLILNSLSTAVLATEEKNNKVRKIELKSQDNEQADKFIQLTNKKLVEQKVGWGSLSIDKNLDGNPISLLLDGQQVEFSNGIVAHASSTLVYDLTQSKDSKASSQFYDRFVTYVGIDRAQGNNGELKFTISGSKDQKSWTKLKETEKMTGASDAMKVDVNIKDYKYLKLEADSLGHNAHDHATYANPMLCSQDYNDELVKELPELKTILTYDKEIQELYNKEFLKAKDLKITESLQKLVWQRTFVKRFGFYNIKKIVTEDKDSIDALRYILENQNNALSSFIQGGTLDKGGKGYQALTEWVSLYKKYKADFNNKSKNSALWLKVAVATAITHGNNVNFWTGNNPNSKAVDRYAMIKKLYDDGRMAEGIRTKNIHDFENLHVDMMRWITNNQIDNKEIHWFADYALKEKKNNKEYLNAYNYIEYGWGYDYSKDDFHNLDKADEYNKKYNFSYLYDSKEQYQNKNIHHLWQVFEDGSVCGGLAKTYANVNQIFGAPASVTGQPGHAATYVADKKDGKIIWFIANDITGFAQSEKGERLPLAWGTNYSHNNYNGSYLLLSAEALNHPEKFNESNDYVLLAECLNQKDEKIKCYKKALDILNINLDAIQGLIKVLKENNGTDDEYKKLAEYVANIYKYHPMVMNDVLKEIRLHMKEEVHKVALDTLIQKTLKQATQVTDKEFIQPNDCKSVAQSLIGIESKELATFSFDGENAGKIVLNKKYENSAIRWEYTLDGWKTKKETDQKVVQLTKEEIEKINSENGIELSLVGTDAKFKIDITKGKISDQMYQNDWENKFIASPNRLEYRKKGTNEWKDYNEDVTFNGQQTLEVRTKAQKTQLASDIKEYTFKENNSEKYHYIPLSNISLFKYCSEQNGDGSGAKNMLDGNPNTMWHNSWNGDSKRYYSVKFDSSKVLSRIEYLPRESGNNGRLKEAVIYVSDDGKDWQEIQTFNNIADNHEWKTFTLDKPVKATYVAIEGKQTHPNNQFYSGRMWNFYEDITERLSEYSEKVKVLSFLSEDEKQSYIDQLKPSADLKSILEKATRQNSENEKKAKDEANKIIDQLDLENKSTFKEKIKSAKSPEEISKIIEEAKKSEVKKPVYHKDGRYASIIKDNETLWRDLDFKEKKGSTSSVYQKTVKVKGYYTHPNGLTYASLYDKDNKWLGYVDSHAIEYQKTSGGKYYSVNQYGSVVKNNYTLWRDLDFKEKKGNTKSIYQKTVKVKGKYHHFNGATYLSLYNKDNKWLGYVNTGAIEEQKTSGGKYYSVNQYGSVVKNNYTLWRDLDFKEKKGNTKSIYQKTVKVKGKYHHFNGATYLSLYDKDNKWLGYVNTGAIEEQKTSGGKYYSVNQYGSVVKNNYTLWRDLDFKEKKGNTKSIYKQKVMVKGNYHHFNGSTYVSLYDKNNKWLGYVNIGAIKY